MAKTREKSFTLRVTAHGAGACVELPNRKEFTVLFCKLDDDGTKPKTYVRFPKGCYKGGRPVKRGADPTLRHIELSGERLFIKAKNIEPHDRALRLNKSRDPVSSTPTAFDAESLLWLPAIRKLAPKHGKINPAYFDDPLAADPPLVAQLVFTQGRLGTTGVERMMVPFKKEKATKGVRRAMAREVLLQMEIHDDHFILESHPLKGRRDSANDMRFDANGAKTLDIVIGNEPEHDIYWKTPPIAPIDILERDAAKEYTFYYKLCADRPSDPLMPHVVARPAGQMFCTKPLFDPFPGT